VGGNWLIEQQNLWSLPIAYSFWPIFYRLLLCRCLTFRRRIVTYDIKPVREDTDAETWHYVRFELMKTATFDEALDIIESLPEEQKESIIEIVKHRLIEDRRDQLVQNIKEAREEYSRGEVRRGTVDDLFREIAQWEQSFGVMHLQDLSNKWIRKRPDLANDIA
jgi:hypothetical protein